MESIQLDMSESESELLDIVCVTLPEEMQVVVVMATYNGERYIEEQIRSLQKQTYGNWKLLVRDDGSTDGTVAAVQQLASADARIRLVQDDSGNQGAIGNFSLLMESALAVDADYVLCSDQDDVWLPNKIETLLSGIYLMEQKYGAATPLLVHGDLVVVDEQLHTIAESFVRYAWLNASHPSLGNLLYRNQVTGCATLFNRSLLQLAIPIPEQAMMHDWWLALLAAAAGKVGYVPKQLLLYRQHGRNTLGAVSVMRHIVRLLTSPLTWYRRRRQFMQKSFAQAAAVFDRLQSRRPGLTADVSRQIRTYAEIEQVAPWSRVRRLHRFQIRGHLLFDLVLISLRKK